MTEQYASDDTEDLEGHFLQVLLLLEQQTLSETDRSGQALVLVEKRELLDKIMHKEHLTQLSKKLIELHPADIAHILESLPLDKRLTLWNLVASDRHGEILLEVPNAVRESLTSNMSREELCEAAEKLDTDEIADLTPNLPQNVMQDVFNSLSFEDRDHLRVAMSYPTDSVGALMDFKMVHVRADVTLEVVSRYLRRFDELPDHTDQVFVLDRNDRFLGALPVNLIVINEPEKMVSELMLTDIIQLEPDEKAGLAAQKFVRYNLVSAPVVDEDGKLAGRVTVNVILDFIRTESEVNVLSQVGLCNVEDIFASAWKSVQNRWAWLALNLSTAFIASRVISGFENTIEKYVALATLMPIVAGFAGSSANQTSTIIRSLAIGQISQGYARDLVLKEMTISGLNGMIWGSIAGLFTFFLYQNVTLGIVMFSAILLNLTVGTIVVLSIPYTMLKLGLGPTFGSSVIITAITNGTGYLIFLGLAMIFLNP